jgi:hypothetical protein
MAFSVLRFNGLLANTGQNVQWRRATLCPCRNPQSGAARQSCPVCTGKGVIWDAPVSAWTGFAGAKVMKEWMASGAWQQGDVVLSIPSNSPLYVMGLNDRVVLTATTVPFNAVLTHTGAEKLLYSVVSVDEVGWLASTTATAMTAGGIPTQNADGTLTWASGAPPAGQQYTIRGRANPQYFALQDMPADRPQYGQALPRRAPLRLFDLFGR